MRSIIGDAITWSGGPKGVAMEAILLKPVPITRANLNVSEMLFSGRINAEIYADYS